MGQNLNAINQSPVKGQLSAVPNPSTLSCVILSTSVNAFVAASPVKLVSGNANEYVVDLAGVGDNIFGFIVYGPKKNIWTKADRVEVALTGSVMEMESAIAFQRGAVLELVAAGTLVTPFRGVNSYIGHALDMAPAANVLVRVLIETALEEGSSSSSSCRSSSSSCSSSSCRSSSSSCSSSSSLSSSSCSSSSSCRSSSSSSSSSAI